MAADQPAYASLVAPCYGRPVAASYTTSRDTTRYRVRAGIEGTLSQGVRAFGMRRSRYIGLAKTGLQQACTAAAMNVSRIVNWLDEKPRAKTRVTRFTALAQTA